MRRLLAAFALALLVALGAPTGHAATNPDEILADPVQEERARALSKELRCLVCQNQSIDDSDAELARDLRRLVREKIVDGQSDGEILSFLTARYGDFVLLRPPVRPETWGLWFGPLVVFLLAAAGLGLWLYRRRRSPPVERNELSEAERARLEALLGERDRAPEATTPR
jgi:cytochrome c-type biogenesis protein CcmH